LKWLFLGTGTKPIVCLTEKPVNDISEKEEGEEEEY
jgi:hypothetical protein